MKLVQFLTGYTHYLGWILGVVIVSAMLVQLLRKIPFLISWRQALRREGLLLQLTPPVSSAANTEANEQLIRVLHGLNSSRSWQDKLLGREVVMSSEICSTREGGIRFLLHVDKQRAELIRRLITTHTPNGKVSEVQEYLPLNVRKGKVLEFKLKHHWGFALAHRQDLNSHDPIAYLINAMTNLGKGEFMDVQLVFSPVVHPQAHVIAKMAINNEDVIGYLRHNNHRLLPRIGNAFAAVSFGALDLLSEVTAPASGENGYGYTAAQRQLYDRMQVTKRVKPARTLSEAEQGVHRSIHDKVSQPLFRTSLRVYIAADDPQTVKDRTATVRSALSAFAVPGYQEFSQKVCLSHYREFLFRNRLPSIMESSNSILSASEMAALFHFPSGISKTDNLQTSLSPTLVAPVSLKDGTPLAVLLGRNIHHGVSTDIGLTEAERERHIYIVGGTGNGKTTMLQYAIVQDIKNGNGLAVIDPHGDLAENILKYVPKERISDVIYLNPDDLTHPIGVNLLELPEGLSGDELLREKDLVTESTISVLRKIFSDDDSGGHRIEYVLRNAIQTALTLDNPTLFTIFRLLNDSNYRKKVVRELQDKDLKIFWQNELGKAGDFQRVKMAAGITAKIGRFLFSASARRVLEQEKSTIDFDDVINSGKILVCNFSKGLLGEDTSALFGTTILAKLQTATLRRARLRQPNRQPYYLYVDEFQNFATMAFVQMLSEARKYKLFLTMAEQSVAQQEQHRLVDIILANVGTVVCFRSGGPADELYILPLFSPYVKQGEIASLPAYNFYMRIAAQKSYEPLSGETVLLPDEGSETIAAEVIQSSRKLYAKKPVVARAKKKTRKKTAEAIESADIGESAGRRPNEADSFG